MKGCCAQNAASVVLFARALSSYTARRTIGKLARVLQKDRLLTVGDRLGDGLL